MMVCAKYQVRYDVSTRFRKSSIARPTLVSRGTVVSYRMQRKTRSISTQITRQKRLFRTTRLTVCESKQKELVGS